MYKKQFYEVNTDILFSTYVLISVTTEKSHFKAVSYVLR